MGCYVTFIEGIALELNGIELNKMNERITIAMLQWENELHLIILETSTIDSLERQRKT